MRKRKTERMEQLAPWRRRHPPVCRLVSVQSVAGNRMPKVRGMDADLVHASRIDLEFHERQRTMSGQYRPVRHRSLSVSFNHSHAMGIPRLPPYERVQRPRSRAWHPMQHRQISLFHLFMPLESGPERPISPWSLRHNHHAARLPVETMDYARARGASHAGERRAMCQQRVHKRTGRISWCWMDYHPGRFVYHDNVRILVDDLHWNTFGLRHLVLLRHDPAIIPYGRPVV